MTYKIQNKAILLSIIICSFLTFELSAQVGVGTTTPRGALDISSTTQGMVPPQVALTSLTVQAPVVNPQGGVIPDGTLVWNTNTAGTIPNNVSPGLYYWLGTRWISVAGSPGGLDWSIIGNGGIDGGVTGVTGVPATQGTHFVGTYDTTNFDIRTSGLHAARASSLGEFFIGALETVLPGDLMNGVSEGNAVFPWAVNGYTDQNGGGVYGAVTGGTTLFAGVQGEYRGTNSQGPGVRGLTTTTTSGSNFTTDVGAGVHGQMGGGSITSYTFGVKGDTGANLQRRTGGVLGTDFLASGSLGYYANNGTSYAVYAFGGTRIDGGAGGKTTSNYVDTSIGLGVHGGVIGAWVKGHEYGTVFTGDRFANYNQGKTITNEAFIVLDEKQDGSRAVSYANTSMSQDIQDKGRGKLTNGTSYIPFNKDYSQIIDESAPIIVTVTPYGESNGVHIVSVDKNGFTIKENKGGQSNVSFNWIAIAEKKIKATPISTELLSSDFDRNINAVMSDENSEDSKVAIWSENGTVKFGNAPVNPAKTENISNQKTALRYDEAKRTPRRENLRASQLKTLKKK